MKILFAVNNEKVSKSIIKKYQDEYKEIISYKNVYYFNAILKELQKDKSYDRIIISEDLEPFTNNNFEQIDKFIFEKLDDISDEATNSTRSDTPIILICTDRRTKSDDILVKLFSIGIYNALIGTDRNIDEICKLLKVPRTKKEAKIYYKIDSEEVAYQSENENDVSESEIQSILSHYKKIGKDEQKCVDAFDSIAEQYTDVQLKVIASVLPLNVKAILEEKSPKYQQIMTLIGGKRTGNYTTTKNAEKDESGIKIGFIENTKKNPNLGPVIIPSTVNTKNVKKVSKRVQTNSGVNIPEAIVAPTPEIPTITESEKNEKLNSNKSDIPDLDDILAKAEAEKKKRRGRPPKAKSNTGEEETVDKPKRKRGRPPKAKENTIPGLDDEDNNNNVSTGIIPGFDDEDDKNNVSTGTIPGFDDEDDDNNVSTGMIPGFDDDEDDDNNVSTGTIPGFDDEDDKNNVSIGTIPGFDDEDDDNNVSTGTIPGFDDEDDKNNVKTKKIQEIDDEDDDNNNLSTGTIPGFDDADGKNNVSTGTIPGFDDKNDVKTITNQQPINPVNNYRNNDRYNQNTGLSRMRRNYPTDKINALITKEKKIVTFVGTSKNGTSFLINNIADSLSKKGIDVAILDATKNRNAYYIYTENEEEKRQIAEKSIPNLINGVAAGLKVSKTLTVYTALPDDDIEMERYEEILSTLVKNHSLILIDCDFNTDFGYFAASQEIYLVQSMDILTIQPLTAFLRDLQSKNIYKPENLRIVINKELNVRTLTVKTIIGGISFYNDPAMSFMRELFNRDTAKYCTIPFNIEAYSKYLEGLVNCKISVGGYSKEFLQALRTLENMVYPLLDTASPSNRAVQTNYGGTRFSSEMNDTLSQMKRNF